MLSRGEPVPAFDSSTSRPDRRAGRPHWPKGAAVVVVSHSGDTRSNRQRPGKV